VGLFFIDVGIEQTTTWVPFDEMVSLRVQLCFDNLSNSLCKKFFGDKKVISLNLKDKAKLQSQMA